jgi:hypothetical protein
LSEAEGNVRIRESSSGSCGGVARGNGVVTIVIMVRVLLRGSRKEADGSKQGGGGEREREKKEKHHAPVSTS